MSHKRKGKNGSHGRPTKRSLTHYKYGSYDLFSLFITSTFFLHIQLPHCSHLTFNTISLVPQYGIITQQSRRR
jgi:hypothetical protein